MKKQTHLIHQFRHFSLAESAETVQRDACLQIVQPAVWLRQGKTLFRQLSQRTAGFRKVLKFPNLLPAHVNDYKPVCRLREVMQTAVQRINTQRNGSKLLAKPQGFIAKSGHM